MLDQFQAAAEAVGATVKRFISMNDAASYVAELAGDNLVSSSYLPGDVKLELSHITFCDPESQASARLCVSFAMAGIASTGSLILDLHNHTDRAATALSLIHAVIVKQSAIVYDLYETGKLLETELASQKANYLSITTGPSRTADIERVLTIGVHGPKELHILIMEGA